MEKVWLYTIHENNYLIYADSQEQAEEIIKSEFENTNIKYVGWVSPEIAKQWLENY